jgi:UDP-N-acetylglucosamine 2-epimerase (non-hydrolysing)
MKVMIVFGTRPELIKFIPVIYTLRDSVELSVVHTLQHEELTDDILDFFKIKPDFEAPDLLHISTAKSNQNRFGGDLPNIMREVKPRLVIVQGDTLTAFIGALVAFELKIPVLHLEAGLRTGNRFSPYPEEILRMLITQIAEFHFAPTPVAAKELTDKGIPRDRVYVTGNTVIDAAILTSNMLTDETNALAMSKVAQGNCKNNIKDLVLITAHRNENIGAPLKQICQSVKKLCDDYPDIHFIWLLHRNPKVRKIVLDEFASASPNMCLIEAVSYPLMIWLMKWSICILTDSGGIQEEATALHVPLIILREHTERPETLNVLNAKLVGSNPDLIISAFHSLINKGMQSVNQPSPFGDGKTSLRLKKFLEHPDTKRFLINYPASAEFIFSKSNEWMKVDI